MHVCMDLGSVLVQLLVYYIKLGRFEGAPPHAKGFNVYAQPYRVTVTAVVLLTFAGCIYIHVHV